MKQKPRPAQGISTSQALRHGLFPGVPVKLGRRIFASLLIGRAANPWPGKYKENISA